MRAHRAGAGRARAAAALATIVLICCAMLAAGIGDPAVARAEPAAPTADQPPRSRFVEVPDSPGGLGRIRIDTDRYLPASLPAPAVLLAHGFGQDKTDLVPEAQRLQRE